LEDTDALRKIRAGYPDYPNAQKPPFVLQGDEVVASDWWLGKIMTTQAEQWTLYWTNGKGRLATTAAAQLLAQEANEDDVLSAYVPSLEAPRKRRKSGSVEHASRRLFWRV
jgi:purine nucleoside permease